IIATAPPMILCSACSDNFERLQKLLKEFGLDYEIDKRLVRGLDYYTGLVF
ncbi:TPA: histidine--tRNA ligase, partial [bacterium]|nr:histidine--tRNA ligase [bacterium]